MVSLVTGASGLLGHALAHRLADQGTPVRVLLRDKAQSALFNGTTVEAAYGCLEDIGSLRKALVDVDELFHCAATSTDWAPWERYYAGNVIGVENLLNAVSDITALRRFLHVSSTDVYGYPKRVCDESAPMVDVGLPYNRTKIIGEKHVWAAMQGGLPVTVVRPATLYGPRDNNFVRDVLQHLNAGDMPLIAGGRSSPGLLYIDNAVDALIAAARSDNTLGKAYNLRDETVESWRDYIHALADTAQLKRTRLRLPFNFAYAMGWSCERFSQLLARETKPLLTRHAVLLMAREAAFPIERAKADFGFRSRVSFAEGVRRSVAWATAASDQPAIIYQT